MVWITFHFSFSRTLWSSTTDLFLVCVYRVVGDPQFAAKFRNDDIGSHFGLLRIVYGLVMVEIQSFQ